MEPSLNPTSYPPLGQRPDVIKRSAIAIGILLLIIVFGWIAWASFEHSSAAPFHVTGEDPALGSITSADAFVKVTFNKPLAPGNYPITSTPNGTVKSSSISGSTLTINFNLPIQAGTNYTLNLDNIKSTTGDTATTQLKFNPTPTTGQTAKDQEQAVMQQQTQEKNAQPYSQQDLIFNGMQPMLDNGMTDTQEQNLQYAYFQYFKSSGQQKYLVFTSNVSNPAPPDANGQQNMTFNVQFDGGPGYNGTVVYHDFTYARLYLRNSAGALVYDSGDLNVFN